MLEKIKQDSETSKSKKFITSLGEPDDEYTSSQQRKVLLSFVADGILRLKPHREPLADLIATANPETYYHVDSFVVTLIEPNFTEVHEKYASKFRNYTANLRKEYDELYVDISDRKYLIHKYKAGSTLDDLIDELFFKQHNKRVQRDDLINQGILRKTDKSLAKLMHKAGFTGIIAQIFVPIREATEVKLSTSAVISTDQMNAIEQHFKSTN